MKDLGQLEWFLGVRVLRDRDAGKVWLCQDSYINKLATEYKLNVRGKLPQAPLPVEELMPNIGDADIECYHVYAKKIGSLIYPAVMTRPDIARAASKLAEMLKNPNWNHVQAADYCMLYLWSTRHLAIEYSAHSNAGELSSTYDKLTFQNTADASFANNTDRRSGEGYTFKLFGGLVDWASRKQATVSTSTTEAELLAMLHAGKQAMWWQHFFNKINFDTGDKLVIFNDNKQTVRLLASELDLILTKLRHIDVSQHWLRERVQEGDIQVEWLETASMTADGMTKLLTPQRHKHFIDLLGLVDATHLVLTPGQ